MEKRVAQNSRHLFSFKKWNVIFNFSIRSHWKIFCKNMCSAKGFSGIKLFLNCGKNPWWMKFNFLIKNVTCNFTKYGTPFARSSHRRYSVKKVFLKISQENVCIGVSFYWRLEGWRPAALFKRDSNQVFSCEICKIFRKSSAKEHLRTTVSTSQVLFNDFHQTCSTTVYVVLGNNKRFYA